MIAATIMAAAVMLIFGGTCYRLGVEAVERRINIAARSGTSTEVGGRAVRVEYAPGRFRP